MTKYVLAFFLMFGVISQMSGQNFYQSAVGLRLGSPVSVSYKTFINETAAIEACVGFRSYDFGGWLNVSGAYQIHQALPEILDGLQWYYGAGASIFFWNYDDDVVDGFSNTSLGIQGYLGLDYTLEDHPIQFTIDWIPTIFIGDTNVRFFGADYGSLGIRYILE